MTSEIAPSITRAMPRRSLRNFTVSPAWELTTYLTYLEAEGVPWRGLAERVGLPRHIPAPDSLLPIQLCSQLVHELVRQEGFAELSARTALGPGSQLQIWQPVPPLVTRSLAAPSLYAALQMLCQQVQSRWSGLTLWLHETPEELWFCSHNPPGMDARGAEQTVQGRLTQLVAIVERYLGCRWRPRVIWLETRQLPSTFLAEIMGGASIRPGAGFTAFPIPRVLLANSGPLSRAGVGIRRTEPEEADASQWDRLQRLQAVLPEYVLDGRLTIDRVANIAGVHVRTLQRALADEGVTFRQMLDNVRVELARQKLADLSLSVAQVGQLLGYSEPTNFARAFRRVAGRSPSGYRSDLLSGRAELTVNQYSPGG